MVKLSIVFKLGVAYEEFDSWVKVIGLEKLNLKSVQDSRRVVKCSKTECYSKFIAIQEVINEKPVKEIGSKAFQKSKIERVSLPKSIKVIENNAFRDCTALKSVLFSEGLVTIKDYAFRNCKALEIVQLPKSVKLIGRQVFMNCESLELIQFSEGLEELGYEALRECCSLQSVTLPKSLKRVGRGVFRECSVFLEVKGKKLSNEQKYGV